MEIYCLKGAHSSPGLFGLVVSKRLRERILEIRQRLGSAGSWVQSTLMSHFFLQVREFFVLHRMVGRIWRGV